jgi:signal transduction histidine kinase
VLIYQLFYNLVNNSLKFSAPDRPPVIRVSSEMVVREGVEMTKIVISDNGIGFNDEYAEKIFDTFTRLNSKDKYEGTGLGLALCKKIVERHHGRISAAGEKDKGASFTVLLPLRQVRPDV